MKKKIIQEVTDRMLGRTRCECGVLTGGSLECDPCSLRKLQEHLQALRLDIQTQEVNEETFKRQMQLLDKIDISIDGLTKFAEDFNAKTP